MSIKTFLTDSNSAQYTAEEITGLISKIASEGVLDTLGTNTDFQVTQSTVPAMTVDVAIGTGIVSYLKNARTWKVLCESNAVQTLTITANSSGANRLDAVVIHLKQDDANALKTNVAELIVCPGDGVTALSDADIDSYLGDTNWYRLADVTVANGASSIVDGNIADTRDIVTLDLLPTDGDSNYVTLSGNQTITGNKVWTGSNTFDIDDLKTATTGAPTADASVPNKKYVDDLVASSLLAAISLTCAEAIDGSVTPQYVAYGSTNMKDAIKIYDTGSELKNSTGTDRPVGNADATTKLGQTFVHTDALATTIKANDLTVFIKKSSNPTDNFYCEIHEIVGDTVIANGTSDVIAGTAMTTGYLPYKFTWSTPPTLVSGTTYKLVFRRSGANDGTNYYNVLDANGDTYAGGTISTYTASSGLWANVSADIKMQLVLNISYGGKAVKCDADHICRSNGLGFIITNVGAGVSGNVYYDRHVAFSGLVDGSRYVAGISAGALVLDTATPVANTIDAVIPHVIAGDVIGNSIKIRSSKRASIIDDKIGVIGAVANVYFDLLVPVGFRPDETIIKYHYHVDTTYNSYSSYVIRFVGDTLTGEQAILKSATGNATATIFQGNDTGGGIWVYPEISYGSANPAVSMQGIYDNAVLIRILIPSTNATVSIQAMEFIKY